MTYFHSITGCNLALSLMFTSPFGKNVLFKLGDLITHVKLNILLWTYTYIHYILWVMEVEVGEMENQPAVRTGVGFNLR